MITYSQLTKKAMPPSKEKTAKRCVVSHYVFRPICNIISIPLIEIGVEPTTVTIWSLIPLIAAFFVFLFSKDQAGFIWGWILVFVWNIMDGIDGNIARYCEKTSYRGEMWDATVGWIAVIVFYGGMGFAAYRLGNILPFKDIYLYLGGLIAIFWLFPRLVMHKKAMVYHAEDDKDLKELWHEKMNIVDVIKLVLFNLMSINGAAAVIFLVCIITNTTDVCLMGYLFINFVAFVGSLWKLLK